MTKKELASLEPGDLIRHRHSPEAQIVMANFGTYAIAARIQHVSNPAEWDLITDKRRQEKRR